MFDDNRQYKMQTAATAVRSAGDKDATRPPELTRDRCPLHQPRSEGGTGKPHSGVFDIAWIKSKHPNGAKSTSSGNCRAGITSSSNWPISISRKLRPEIDTTHYVMGGIRVDAESQMASVPGLFAAGEVGAGLHGANRLGGNSLSDLLVFGKRLKLRGEYAKMPPLVRSTTHR